MIKIDISLGEEISKEKNDENKVREEEKIILSNDIKIILKEINLSFEKVELIMITVKLALENLHYYKLY